MILSAVGKDGNNQMYPIAWAVVEGENANSWRWFVNILSQGLWLTDGRGWTIISDQQKGLIEATHELLPDAEHRKCARHVYANWKAKNKTDRVRELFWKAVYACNENDWKKATKEMETIEGTELGSTPFTDFMAAEPRSFCRAFMSTMSKCDSVESNICETFNGTIVKYRGLRIIDMLEGIRLYMMDSDTTTGGGNSAATTVPAGNNTAAPTVPARNNAAAPTVPDTRRKRVLHCSKCQSATHNARTCPLNRGNGIQDVMLNVGDRRTIDREMRVATRGIGVYVSEATGNQYVRLNGSRGRPAGGT